MGDMIALPAPPHYTIIPVQLDGQACPVQRTDHVTRCTVDMRSGAPVTLTVRHGSTILRAA